ncbi:MAG: NRDE family protein [Burkholderiaceae bacterium]
MCLIAFAFGLADRSGPALRLASNRDEYYSRPTEPAHWWLDAPDVFGGRDELAGGTWLAASRQGRVAAITNHRNGLPAKAPRSRGALVADFLRTDEPIADYARRIAGQCADYGGFNLVLFELAPTPVAWYVNDIGEERELAPGLYGISNDRLDTAWPKVERLKACMARSLADPATMGPDLAHDERLFDALLDRDTPAEHMLPESGVGIARERYLSTAFIAPDRDGDLFGGYGTRASTLIEARDDGRMRFTERSWNTPGAPAAGYRERDESFARGGD